MVALSYTFEIATYELDDLYLPRSPHATSPRLLASTTASAALVALCRALLRAPALARTCLECVSFRRNSTRSLAWLRHPPSHTKYRVHTAILSHTTSVTMVSAPALPHSHPSVLTPPKGCCTSRLRGDAPANQPSASQRNINDPTPPNTSAVSSPRGSASNPVVENRPNVLLKPIDPAHRSKLPKTLASPTVGSHRQHVPLRSDSLGGPFTRHRLEKERNDWWDTRTTGSPQIWAALRSMVQSLQGGNIREAQVLLDAIECTCPNGMLWRGIFDNRGEWYKVPEWIVIEPEGVVEDEDLKDEAGSVGDDEDKEVDVDDLGDEVQVRCRLSTTGKDYMVNVRKGDRVATLVTNLKAKTGVSLPAPSCLGEACPSYRFGFETQIELTMCTVTSLRSCSYCVSRQAHRGEPNAGNPPVLELRR